MRKPLTKVIHIGKVIKRVLQDRGMTAAELGRRIGKTGAGISYILEQPSINTDLLVQLSKELDFNFFNSYASIIKGDKNYLTVPEDDKWPPGYVSQAFFESTVKMYQGLIEAERENTKAWQRAYEELKKLRKKS